MSKQEEVDKVFASLCTIESKFGKILDWKKDTAEYLVDNEVCPIRSKGGFETLHGKDAFLIQPIDYKEANE